MPQPVIGLDISDRSIELTALARRKGGFRVIATGRIDIPPGTIALGVIADADALTLSVAKLLDAAFGPKRGPVRAGISLPEMLVYSKTFTFPASLAPDLVRKAVVMEASDLFPIPFHRSVTAMAVVSRSKNTQEVFFAAADRETVAAYVSALRLAGVHAQFAEAESMSLGRALLDPQAQEPVLVADMGSRSTLLAVHDKGGLRMSGNVMAAGDALSAAIEHRLGVSLGEAEDIRKRAGFDPSVDDGRVFLAMEQPMHEIMDEMRRTMEYYEERTTRKVSAIVLAGGTSLTPQIVDYIASNFPGVEVRVGNPLQEVSLEGYPDAEQVAAAPVLWSSSIGLALRAAGARGGPDINLLPSARQEGGFRGFLGRCKDAVTRLIAMVTKGRKTAPKRKKAAPAVEIPHEEVSTPVAPEVKPSIPTKSEATVAGALSSLEALVSSAPASAAAVSVPALEPAKAVPPAPVHVDVAPAVVPEEKDYGANIGDILAKSGSIETTDMQVSLSPESAADVAETRRSIASILEQRNAPAPQVRRTPAVAPALRASSVVAGKGRPLGMLLVVILLFVVATGGVAMFIWKNGAPKMPSLVVGLFDRGSETAPAPAPDLAAPDAVHVSLLLAAKETSHDSRSVVVGRVIETDVVKEGTFPATGAGAATAEGKARGKATIINESSQSYTFVATTRLLSKEGVLFRMVTASAIPANGSVTVDVAADQPGAAGDVGPTTFTIPGLPVGTQKVVYAKSDAAMSGGAAGAAKTVTQSDVDTAKEAVAERARAEAYENLKATLAEGEQLNEDLVTVTETSVVAPVIGAAAAEFTVRLSFSYRALLLPEPAIIPLLDAAFGAALPSGLSVADYSLGAPHYAVEAYDSTAEKAEVRVEAPVIARHE